MQPRDSHTATAFSLAPGLTDVTMFGGCHKYKPGVKDNKQPKLAETTVLQFGEFMTSTALVAVCAVVTHHVH